MKRFFVTVPLLIAVISLALAAGTNFFEVLMKEAYLSERPLPHVVPFDKRIIGVFTISAPPAEQYTLKIDSLDHKNLLFSSQQSAPGQKATHHFASVSQIGSNHFLSMQVLNNRFAVFKLELEANGQIKLHLLRKDAAITKGATPLADYLQTDTARVKGLYKCHVAMPVVGKE